jgi:hypothetical protein
MAKANQRRENAKMSLCRRIEIQITFRPTFFNLSSRIFQPGKAGKMPECEKRHKVFLEEKTLACTVPEPDL